MSFAMWRKIKRQLRRCKSRVDYKDGGINRAINRFVEEKRGVHPPKEENFAPEVLIPCFNQGRFLKTALDSINVQCARARCKVTIINDASTDDTLERIHRLQAEHDFTLIDNPVNLNQSGSLNKAIEQSANNLFVVLNADDALTRYALAAILQVLENDAAVRMVGGGCIPFADERTLLLNARLPQQLGYAPIYRSYGPEQARRYRELNDLNMTMSGCAFLKSAWQAAGGFREFKERICSFDDRDFQMRVSVLFEVAVLEEPLAFWRTHSSTGRAQT